MNATINIDIIYLSAKSLSLSGVKLTIYQIQLREEGFTVGDERSNSE